MYLSFYGLNEKPFAITPDPRYLFLSERHGEGLAHLVYGVTDSGGFIQLTGEVGTGKTTLVRRLLGQLPAEADVALILNPQLTALEFLLAICEELGVDLPADTGSSKALVDALNRHLLGSHGQGRRTILLVDEAQNLSAEVLEQLRLLTNLETAQQKLLQIILIGQPELRAVLAQNSLRQLAQRVTGRYHLEPLSRDETLAYIDHRMKVAGALTEVFEPAAKRRVFRLSGGIPRLINVICDRALLGAYSEGSRSVGDAVVRRAAAEVAGDEGRRRAWLLPAAAVAVLGIGGAVAWWWQNSARLALPEPEVALPLAAVAQADENEAVAEPDAVAVPAAAEPPAPGPPALDAILETRPTTVDGALADLLRLWGTDAGDRASCEQAAALGLSCLRQRGSWPVLKQLDRPAVLTLIDSGGVRHFPLLTGFADDGVELDFAGESHRLPLAAVSDLWFGDYLLVWRPPTGRIEALRPGSRGDAVLWLRQSLAELQGNLPDDTSDDPELFDGELESRLRDFQRRHRLEVDGLAGQQTQILINSMLASENTPRLTDPLQ